MNRFSKYKHYAIGGIVLLIWIKYFLHKTPDSVIYKESYSNSVNDHILSCLLVAFILYLIMLLFLMVKVKAKKLNIMSVVNSAFDNGAWLYPVVITAILISQISPVERFWLYEDACRSVNNLETEYTDLIEGSFMDGGMDLGEWVNAHNEADKLGQYLDGTPEANIYYSWRQIVLSCKTYSR